MTDPHAELYSFIFRMVESQPSFRVGARTEPKAPASPAMLARVYKGILPADYACEPKIDGVRVIVTVCRESGSVSFNTRNGNPLRSLDHLAGWFRDTSEAHGVHTFDCEAVSGCGFFDGVGRLRSHEPALDAMLWLLDLPDDCGTYSQRRRLMERFSYATVIKLVPSHPMLEPVTAFRTFTSQGFEGVMVKDTCSYYQQGKRSNAWLKVKELDTEDCPIVSVHEGKGRLVGTMGHVVVQFAGRLVRVGGGFTDAQRAEIWANRDEVIGSWLEVSFQSTTPTGSLRHPRIRGDK